MPCLLWWEASRLCCPLWRLWRRGCAPGEAATQRHLNDQRAPACERQGLARHGCNVLGAAHRCAPLRCVAHRCARSAALNASQPLQARTWVQHHAEEELRSCLLRRCRPAWPCLLCRRPRPACSDLCLPAQQLGCGAQVAGCQRQLAGKSRTWHEQNEKRKWGVRLGWVVLHYRPAPGRSTCSTHGAPNACDYCCVR